MKAVSLFHASGFLLALLLTLSGPLSAQPAFDEQRLSFSVSLNGERSDYARFFALTTADRSIPIKLETPARGREFRLEASAGKLTRQGPASWLWQPPAQAGIYPASLTASHRDSASNEVMSLQLIVLTPLSNKKEDGRLNGFRVGHYPSPRVNQPIDRRPPGLIEVTEKNRDTPLSPHFQLSQFLSKQPAGYPMYVMVRPRLILKLELLLADVNRELGVSANTFHVMSGYRTPFYNQAIKNVAYSRHVWGGAADIFVDQKPPFGRMDDLDGDGLSDRADARLLYDLAVSLPRRHNRPELEGGVGEYGPTPWRGPFVHVDVRGSPARWGRPPE